MKKVLFSLAVLLISNMAFAQLSKGSLLVTGAASGSSRSYTGEGSYTANFYFTPFKETTFSLSPQVSYLLSNRFAIGLEGGYVQRNYESVDKNNNLNPSSTFTYRNNSNRYTVGQFIRYYLPLRQNFYFYFQESATFFSGKGEYLNIVTGPFSNSESKYTYDISGYSIVFRPGLQYFLSNRVAIDVAIDLVKYTNHKEKNNTSTDHHKEFQVNLIPNSVTLGLSYRFGGTTAQ